ncbi:hypothetical protein HMPREF0556_plasmid12616 (plasmid) [Listeria grayi DSM 20601]|uniref:Uncharacterized protein n=1 Tax=Listeria grayi DSM 20601 TaxID=525367 RepID=D7V1J1_LISGR|nr:hypothetical protein HMPREF0556_plasmid12616 [Listeria grayi DSM 20601]
MKRELCVNIALVQTPFKMVTAMLDYYKIRLAVKLMGGFYFLSFLLFMIVTTKTAKAIISVRLS